MAFPPDDEKYLFYENQGGHVGIDGNQLLLEGNATWLWNDRLLLVEHKKDSEHWHFTAIDLITNETRPVHFSKSQSNFRRVRITPLNKDYGFVIESADDSFCVNLVKLKWAPGEFQLIEQFEQAGHFPEIIVDSLSPSKFVLKYVDIGRFIHQACTLDSGKIEVIGTYDVGFYEHYFNDTLFSFYTDEIDTYNLATAEEQHFDVEDINHAGIDIGRVEWVKERLYATVLFDENGPEKFGIAYTDFKTLNWNFLDLRTDLTINKIQYFDGNLIVYANNGISGNIYSNEFKVYSIPVKQPQKLRKMAWPLVLQQLKRDESIDDPYQTAVKFLPYNCDLRPPWYNEETALEVLKEPESNEQGKSDGDASIQNNVDSTKATADKTNESTLSQELPDDVSLERIKFD